MHYSSHLFKIWILYYPHYVTTLTELILLGDFNVNFAGSNLNIDKAMKRELIQVTNSHELDQLINNTTFLSVAVIFV